MTLQVAPVRTAWQRLAALPEGPTLNQVRCPTGTWRQASRAWLDSQASPHTRRAYRTAVRGFFAHCGKRPWEIAGADIISWQRHLQEQDYSAATRNLRLSALRSFYRYCSQHYTIIDSATGLEQPLAAFNPALRAEREKVTPYGKATYLDATEVKALLRAVDRSSATGLRDYALILAYIYTGRRSSEIRRLKWGDIRVMENRAFYRWSGKGGVRREDELPWPVYHAITDYLKAAAQLRDHGSCWEPEPDSYIFIALSEVAERLPCVRRAKGYTKECGLNGRQPLSSSSVNRIIKRQARRAGLRSDSIHTHTLRHTAAMLRRQLTDNLQEIQQFLNHSSLSTTQIYLQHAERRQDDLWMKVESLIRIE